MPPFHATINAFIDIEAAEDENEDEEDSDDVDLLDDFLDDSESVNDIRAVHQEENESTVSDGDDDVEHFKNMMMQQPDDDDQLDEFTNDLLARYHNLGTPRRRLHNVEDAEDDSVFARLPGSNDLPIWRVQCRVGTEMALLAFLLLKTQEADQLVAAFSLDHMRGYVFLECNMNLALLKRLQRAPGVISTRSGVLRKCIPTEDRIKLLRQVDLRTDYHPGCWVSVTKGLYKGDFGIISKVHAWGVTLVLIPRIRRGHSSDAGKRKASTIRPDPVLFDPEDYDRDRMAENEQNEILYMGRFTIVNGLIEKRLGFESIKHNVFGISWNTICTIAATQHPAILRHLIPKPIEWLFKADDAVTIRDTHKIGVVHAAFETHVEVDIQDEGIHKFEWMKILKRWNVGERVVIDSGVNKGYSGWIIELDEDTVKVAQSLLSANDYVDYELSHVNAISKHHSDHILVHANSINQKPYPTTIANRSQTSYNHKWCGLEVIVNKSKHVRKGDIFKVVGVLFGQPTTSGIRLELQYQRFSVFTPYQKLTLDYDDVVETSTHMKLREFEGKQSKLRLESPANPPDHYHSNIENRPSTPIDDIGSSSNVSGAASMDASPANTWSTTMHPLFSPASMEASPAHTWNTTIHPLFSPALTNIPLQVTVDGGTFKNKDLTITVSDNDGQPAIRYVKYGTSHILQHEWVTPKYPNAAYDNGLLVIIIGDYTGKYVRRLNHRHSDSVSNMTVVVVDKSPSDGMQSLTEHILDLPANYLCVAFETKDERDKSKDLTKSLRAEYTKKFKKSRK